MFNENEIEQLEFQIATIAFTNIPSNHRHLHSRDIRYVYNLFSDLNTMKYSKFVKSAFSTHI